MLVLFILLLQFFLWTSIGQTFVANRATSFLETKLQTVVTIEKVDISFFKFFRLENIYLEDHHQDTLAFIKSIDFGINNIKFKNDTFRLELGMVQIKEPNYFLDQKKGDSLTNLYFVLEPLFSDDSSTSNTNVLINAQNLIIEKGKFIWNNHNFDSTDFGINWDHLNVDDIDVNLSYFKMVNDTFTADFTHLSGKEISGFVLDEFKGKALFNSITTKVDQLHIETPYSDIYTNLEYTYDSIGSYVNFIDQVYMKYEFDTSTVSLKDLSYFAPTLEGLDYTVKVHGKERGPVSEMKFNNLYLKYGKGSIIYGRIFITGLPDVENTSFNCKFKKISTNYSDLSMLKTYPFTENKSIELPPFLKNTGTMSFVGYYNGFYNNFVTAGTFKSLNGSITTDLQLATNKDDIISYRGQITTNNFDLAEITGDEKMFNKTSFNMFVEGSQLNFNTLDLKANGTASRFDFMGYTYTDIILDAGIIDKTISGKLSVADTNLNLTFDGSIALNEDLPKYQFKASIEHLRLKQLHLMDRDSSASLTTEVNFNFKGNSLDNFVGHAGLSDFYFIENGNDVTLKRVDFIAVTDGKNKTLALTSDNINLQITGEYYFGDAIQSLNYMTYKWLPSIYNEPQTKPDNIQKFKLELHTKEFSGFSSIFVPQVSFKDELDLYINYNSELETLDIKSNSHKMTFAEFEVSEFEIEAEITPDTFNLSSQTEKLFFSDSSYIENVKIKSNASENKINSKVTWNNYQQENQNAGNMVFDLIFVDPENFDIKFYDSWVNVDDTTWVIRDSSLIIKQGRDFAFDNILLSQTNQNFSLNGFISEDPTKELVVNVDSFNLNYLNNFLDKYGIETHGIMDGSTVISDFYGDFVLYSKLNFKNLEFNKQKIGNGQINSEWIDQDQKFDINIGFQSDTLKPITVLGDFYPNKQGNQLELAVELDHFPIPVLEPFFKDVVSDMKGTLSGKASVSGTVKEMLFNGDFVINDAAVHINYLNETVYLDNQKAFIRPNLIGADAVLVTDSKKKRAQINFSLFHNNFEDINFDLSVTSIDAFRAFNTKKKDNDYFYGKVYLSPGSTLGLDSDYNGNLNLVANVTSGPGTKVTIPFYDEDEVITKEYIYFKSSKSDTLVVDIKEDSKPVEEGFTLSMDMALELTKEAELQLLFDEFNADKIKAQGDGTINLKVNDAGDFQMFGNYEIDEGYYLFTFAKIISKKFIIRKGSRLTWNGNPYEGVADIKATYKVRTALYELGPVVTAAYTDTSELKKRVPVEVVLKMTDNYMNPDLSFSFELPPKYDEISALLNGLDEGERNKQVFSLLILNKFMPISGGGVSSSANAVGSNGSEVLSNQLSGWLSKINKDVDVGFRYSPGDQITGDEVELALSTQLFNDRVLLETNVGMTSTAKGNTTASSGQTNNFVGEFTISYKINEKGNIVGKVFQRSNELNPVYNNYSPYTQGVGIAYSEPFNTWNNLGCIMANHFHKKDNKRDCVAEYYQDQKDNKDDNQAKIQKMVARSRLKQKKRNEKANRKEEKANRRKNTKNNSK